MAYQHGYRAVSYFVNWVSVFLTALQVKHY